MSDLLKEKVFPQPYHKVVFDLISEGISTHQMTVWVHPAFPDDDLIRVARTFVWSRLESLTEAAHEDAFSEAQIQALWKQVEPPDFSAS